MNLAMHRFVDHANINTPRKFTAFIPFIVLSYNYNEFLLQCHSEQMSSLSARKQLKEALNALNTSIVPGSARDRRVRSCMTVLLLEEWTKSQ